MNQQQQTHQDTPRPPSLPAGQVLVLPEQQERSRKERSYISVEDRLSILPDVFTLSDLALSLNRSKTQASIYIMRWESAGMIEKCGQRAGVYLNLVREGSEHGLDNRMALAVLKRHPLAIRRGLGVLQEHGWLKSGGARKQPKLPTHSLAVPAKGRPDAKWKGVEVVGRPPEWFDLASKWAGEPILGRLRSLDPAAALADACRGRGKTSVVPLHYLDLPKVDWKRVGDAFAAFGQRIPIAYRPLVAKAVANEQPAHDSGSKQAPRLR